MHAQFDGAERKLCLAKCCLVRLLAIVCSVRASMGESHHGYLIKEGAVVKSWKKRYFVLKNEELTYSKKDNADNLGAIDMEDVRTVRPVEYKKKRFCFALETPKRTYYLVAEDEKYFSF